MNWGQIGQILTRIKDGMAFQFGMQTNDNSRPVELILVKVASGEGRYGRAPSFRPTYRKDRGDIL
jgi:hypothetical protein